MAGEFRNLIGNILSVDRFNGSSQLLSKAHIGAQPVFILLAHYRKRWGLYKQGGKIAAKSRCHPCRCTDNFSVGWCGGQTHQNMLIGVVIIAIFNSCAFRQEIHPVRTAAKEPAPRKAVRFSTEKKFAAARSACSPRYTLPSFRRSKSSSGSISTSAT